MQVQQFVVTTSTLRALTVIGICAGTILGSSCGDGSPTSPTPPPSSCSYQLTSGTESLGPEGGTTTVTVSTGAQCAWTARVDADWITISSGTSGTGPGTISLTAKPNEQPSPREGSVTVADQSLKLAQRGRAACEYTVTAGDLRFGAEGGAGSIDVATAAGCPWTAAASASWLTLDATSGSGPARVGFRVAAFTSTSARTATITVANRVMNLRQDGVSRVCEYSATPAEVTQHWHNLGGTVRIVTQSGCRWTVRSTDPWLTFDGSTNRDGPGTVEFRHGAFPEETTRKAALELRWPAESAGQNTWVTQEGCYYGLGQSTATFPKEGGKGSVTVIATPRSQNCMTGCPWTASSNVAWLRIGTATGAGDDMLFYTVDPNPGPTSRSGVIALRGYTLTIIQTF